MDRAFFDSIASRYGISPSALADAWEKTRSDDSVTHVKKFKAYLTALTGSDLNGYGVPSMDDAVQEAIAAEFIRDEYTSVLEHLATSIEE